MHLNNIRVRDSAVGREAGCRMYIDSRFLVRNSTQVIQAIQPSGPVSCYRTRLGRAKHRLFIG